MTIIKSRRSGETRPNLMQAALDLVGEGRHFSSLGIREVTRQAGVVPTAFYRHFRSMDDLGLQLVDELGLLLRRMMREARIQAAQADRMIEESVRVFVDHLQANRSFFLFMAQALSGDSRVVRDAIRSEMRFFVQELTIDVRQMRLFPEISDSDLEMICDLVIRTVAFTLSDLLGVAPKDDFQIQQIRQRTVRQLQLIFLGAGHWKSDRPAG